MPAVVVEMAEQGVVENDRDAGGCSATGGMQGESNEWCGAERVEKRCEGSGSGQV